MEPYLKMIVFAPEILIYLFLVLVAAGVGLYFALTHRSSDDSTPNP